MGQKMFHHKLRSKAPSECFKLPVIRDVHVHGTATSVQYAHPYYHHHLQVDSQTLQWGFCVFSSGSGCLWLMASCAELSRLLFPAERGRQRDQGAADASPQPSVKHGWCTTLWPNAPITQGLQLKMGLHFISTEKPGNVCLRDINTRRSAKNWKQAASRQFPYSYWTGGDVL